MRKMLRKVIARFREKTAHDFSCLMCDLPRDIAFEIISWGERTIPEDDLAPNGREHQIHVTVKYGIHISDFTEIRNYFYNRRPFEITLGSTQFFSNDEHDVIYLPVSSPELHQLNGLISSSFQNTDTHPDYIPHVTIAYVKAGLGPKYNNLSKFDGKRVMISSAIFSGRDNRETTFNFFDYDILHQAFETGKIIND